MELRRIFAGLVVACLAPAQVVTDVERLAVSQVNPQLPVLTAYVTVFNSTAASSAALPLTAFSATFAGKPVRVTDVQSLDSSREGVAYIFLVDVSRSIKPAHFSEIQAAMATWVENLKAADSVAIAAFGSDYRQLTDFTSDRQRLNSVIAGLRPTDEETHLHQAVIRALAFQQREDANLPGRRAIVILSDGKDEGSGATADDVVSRIQANQLPIYAIGFSRLASGERRTYLDVLHRFAAASGGEYRDAEAVGLSASYADIQQSIRNVRVLRVDCGGCKANGQFGNLQVTLTSGKVVTGELSIKLKPAPPSRWERIPWWWYTLAGIGLAGLVLLAVWWWRRKPAGAEQDGLPNQTGWNFPIPGPVPDPTFAQAQSGLGLRLRLTVMGGPEGGRVHDVRLINTARIGRNHECDVVLSEDPKASARHCELALSYGKVVIYDLGSTNKTVVNGVPINGRHRLEDRDSVLVGQTEMRFQVEAGK